MSHMSAFPGMWSLSQSPQLLQRLLENRKVLALLIHFPDLMCLGKLATHLTLLLGYFHVYFYFLLYFLYQDDGLLKKIGTYTVGT